MPTTLRPTRTTDRNQRPRPETWVYCIPRDDTDCDNPTAMAVVYQSFWAGEHQRLAMRYGAVVSAVARKLRADEPTLGPGQARRIAHRWVMVALAASGSPLTLTKPSGYPFDTLVGVR